MRFPSLAIAAYVGLAWASPGARAADASYNPDRLPGDQVARMADLCVNVMGLNRHESPVGGIYRGSPHLDQGVNHYQACIAALSDALQNQAAASAARQATADCRAQGLVSESAPLAECVLRGINSPAKVGASSATDTVAMTANVAPSAAPSNFFLDSPRVTRRKEESACAQLGFVPPGGEFANCVRLLHDDFFSIDNPIS
jgi:hypothetical protein